MGLLEGAMGAQAPQMGGLLGGLGGGAPASPTQGGGLQMAQQLAQNPTPQMAQQIIQQMRQSGMEGTEEIAKILTQVGDDPEAIKQIADAAIKALSGQ